MTGCDWKQGDISGPFYGFRDLALMFRAVAGNPSGNDLASLAYEEPKGPGILVVYSNLLVRAKAADLPALKVSLLSRAVTS